VSFLPLAWISEHVLGIAPHLIRGVVLNFPEEPETVQENIREIAPQGLLFNSRLWENLVAAVQVRINDSTWFNRTLYRLFLPVGYAVAERRFKKQPVGFWLRLLYAVGDVLIFRPLRDQLGLVRARSTYTAGAALSPDVLRFLRALGINLKQIYGSTEVSGGALTHRDDDIKFESVGKPIPGCAIRISDEGEILLSSPGLFRGYHKDPQATREAIWTDENGRRWFRTGDAGTIDEDGHLIYLDRMKDMIRLASGDAYSPQYIEGRLKFSPYIRDVMTVGGADMAYVTALINIDFDNVGRWAEKHGVPYTTFVDLSQKPEVYELIRSAVDEVNGALPSGARVRKFVLMHKAFDADEGELTRTRKLRRRFLAERYQEMIAAMYDGREAIQVRATVKYRDGRMGTVDTTVRIETLSMAATTA
jgi:long-chain acyl-CoA synthetase